MFTNFGYILATMFATVATLFSGHVVGDAPPPPPYITVPGSLLAVPNIFGNRQNAQTEGVPQTALTASAAASQTMPVQPVPPPKNPAPVAATATTSVAKPAAPQGILCHGTYYDACPADTVFQCVDTGRLCRPTSVPAQVLWTSPKKSDCQIQEDQITAQIVTLEQNANQNSNDGGVGTSSSETDTAAQIASLQTQLRTLQSSCSS